MKTREEVLAYGLSFPYTYQDAPFRDTNWQLVRVHGSKKAFLWTYEKDRQIRINIKVDPEWRDFWRNAYDAVLPGYHQNKEHWNTVILDGSVPDDTLKQMITESYDLVADSPTNESTCCQANPTRKGLQPTEKLRSLPATTHGTCSRQCCCTTVRIRSIFRVTVS